MDKPVTKNLNCRYQSTLQSFCKTVFTIKRPKDADVGMLPIWMTLQKIWHFVRPHMADCASSMFVHLCCSFFFTRNLWHLQKWQPQLQEVLCPSCCCQLATMICLVGENYAKVDNYNTTLTVVVVVVVTDLV